MHLAQVTITRTITIMKSLWRVALTWALSISLSGTTIQDLANTQVTIMLIRIQRQMERSVKLRGKTFGLNRQRMINQAQEIIMMCPRRLARLKVLHLWVQNTRRSVTTTLAQASMTMTLPNSSLSLALQSALALLNGKNYFRKRWTTSLAPETISPTTILLARH